MDTYTALKPGARYSFISALWFIPTLPPFHSSFLGPLSVLEKDSALGLTKQVSYASQS